jgi:hypothetical protein
VLHNVVQFAMVAQTSTAVHSSRVRRKPLEDLSNSALMGVALALCRCSVKPKHWAKAIIQAVKADENPLYIDVLTTVVESRWFQAQAEKEVKAQYEKLLADGALPACHLLSVYASAHTLCAATTQVIAVASLIH